MPMLLEMTCWTGYFQHPSNPSLAEVNLRASGNGAVASWAASGLGVGPGHDALSRGFYQAVMQQGVLQIGAATTLGKANLYSSGQNLDLLDTFILLGDPAMRLAVPAEAIQSTPTPTSTATDTASPTATQTNTPTATPTSTSTATPTATSTPTPTATPTVTPILWRKFYLPLVVH